MIGKNFEFNGQAISKSTADYRVGLDVVQWKSLDFSDEQQNIQGYHGIKVSPTFARGRRITLEGIIIADDRESSSMAIDYLESLFALQGVPSQVDLMPFIVTDEQDRRWQLNCKVKEPLSIDIWDSDYLDGSNRRWRVVLQAEDPKYYWVDTQTVVGPETHFWGIKFPVKFGVKFNEYYNEIQVLAQGNVETPLKFAFTITDNIDTPFMIRNITDGTFFALDISAVAWDTIVVDAQTKTATKNWVNVLANRISWSTWPKAIWNMMFSIYDNDWGLFKSDFDAEITFKNVLF